MTRIETFHAAKIEVSATWQLDGALIVTETDKWGMTVGTVFFKPAKPIGEALEALAVCCGIKLP